MKKAFLLAMVSLSTVAFAATKENAKSTVPSKVKTQKLSLKQVKRIIAVTTSCGNTYNVDFPNSWTANQIATWIMGFDAGDCN